MSFTRNDKIVCDNCSRFIAVQDLIDGRATHHCVLDDTEFSKETFASLCPKCVYKRLNNSILKALVEAAQSHVIFIERHNLEILARAVASTLSLQSPRSGQ